MLSNSIAEEMFIPSDSKKESRFWRVLLSLYKSRNGSFEISSMVHMRLFRKLYFFEATKISLTSIKSVIASAGSASGNEIIPKSISPVRCGDCGYDFFVPFQKLQIPEK